MAVAQITKERGALTLRDKKGLAVRRPRCANTRLAVTLLGIASAGSVLAQAAPEIEEVVVTARKQKQISVDVPLALSVLRGETLANLRASGRDIRFLNGRAPSLRVTSSYGRIFPYFFVRGLGNKDFDLNASQPVSVMHDGVVLENPLFKGTPIYDVQRIEVLRGPQGTLFGRNTPAGLVKVESAPPTWAPESHGRLSLGRYDSVNFEGAVSGPLKPSVLAGRVSLLVQRRGDHIANTYTGQADALGGYRDVAARLQLLWTPLDNFEARFKAHMRDLGGTARLFRANALEPGRSRLRTGFRRNRIAVDGQNQQTLAGRGLAVEVRHDRGRYRLVSLTGMEWLDNLSRGDVDGGAPPYGPGHPIPFPSETADGHPHLRQFSQEVRLETDAGPRWTWRVGLYYFRESLAIDSFSFNSLQQGALAGHARQRQRAEAWAVFGAATFNPTERLELDAGLRLSADAKEYQAQRLLSPIGAGPLGPISRRPRDRVPSWDLSVRYRAADGIQPYARLASSFRAPSIQGRLLFGNDVTVADTERIISVEAGVKIAAWRQRLRLDAAAYRFHLRDQQLTAVGGAVNANRLLNAARTAGQGVEVEMHLLLGRALRLRAGASYNHTEIDDPNLFVQPCGSGCIVLDPPGPLPGTVSLHGNSLPNAPRWMANGGISYSWLPGRAGGGEVTLATDWTWRSRMQFHLYDSVEYSDDRLFELGARVAWRSGDGRRELAAFGRNILDDTSPLGGIDFNNLTAYVNEGPFWGVEAVARL